MKSKQKNLVVPHGEDITPLKNNFKKLVVRQSKTIRDLEFNQIECYKIINLIYVCNIAYCTKILH